MAFTRKHLKSVDSSGTTAVTGIRLGSTTATLQTGEVTITPSSIGAQVAGSYAAASHGTHVSSSTCVTAINGQTGNVSLTIPTIPPTPAVYITEFGIIPVRGITVVHPNSNVGTSYNEVQGYWHKYSNGIIEQYFELPPANYNSSDISPYMTLTLYKSFTTSNYIICLQPIKATGSSDAAHALAEVKVRTPSSFTFDNGSTNYGYLVHLIGK